MIRHLRNRRRRLPLSFKMDWAPVKRGIRVLIVAVLVSTALSMNGVVPASAASNGRDPEIAAALDRIARGTYTAEDLQLIRSRPDIASQVPDPTRPVEIGARGGVLIQPMAVGAAGCWWADVWFQRFSLLGFSLYKWHHYVAWCGNGSVVTGWQNRYDYVTDVNSVIYVRELVVNQASSPGSWQAWSHMQRHLEYCVVRYGCYANAYPWSKIYVYGDGRYTYEGSY